jgi:hypothetical protein
MKINPKKIKEYPICNECLENIRKLGTNWPVTQNKTIYYLQAWDAIFVEESEVCRLCGKTEPPLTVAIIEVPANPRSVKPIKYHSLVEWVELIKRKIDSRNSLEA